MLTREQLQAAVGVVKRGGCSVGCHLKKLLGRLHIKPRPGCRCDAIAAELDRRGPDWCQDNIAWIVAGMRDEANKRGLPFVEIAARLLISRAIRNARRAASNASTQNANQTGNP